MAKVRFVPNPRADQLIRSATGSMANVGLALRKAADAVRDQCRAIAESEAAEATGRRDALKHDAIRRRRVAEYQHIKAESWALRTYARMVNAYMEGGKGAEVVGIVIADYAASASVEFGGPDPKVKIPYGGETPLVHPARHILRRGLQRGGR